MPVTKVRSKWENGDLVFHDLSGNEIARFDESAAALDIKTLYLGGTAVTASAAELNILDGVTASAAELNVLDGITATTAQLNAVNSYMVVQAHKSSVAASQADAEVFEFTAPAALTLAGVQVYCTATAATASVDVKEGGTTVLSSAVTPTAGSVASGTIADAAIASGAAVTVHVTTDGTGSITDLTVTLVFKAAHVA